MKDKFDRLEDIEEFDDDDFYEDDYDYYVEENPDNVELSYEELDDYEDYDDYLDKNLSQNNEINNRDEEYVDTYEEKVLTKEEKHFDISKYSKVFIIILIIAILILIIAIGKAIGNSNDNKKEIKDDVTVIKKDKDIDTSKMFNDIKNASLKYYNKDNISDNNTLTLQQLIDNNLITVKDDKFDKEKTKSILSKTNDEYNLKVYVVYKDKEKTKSYNVNNYIYCDNNYLCERNIAKEKLKYEYVLENEPTLSIWSSWSDKEETSCQNSNITCDNNDKNCLKEVSITSKEYTDGTKEMTYQTSRSAFKTLDKEIRPICASYDYVKVNGTYYRTIKNSNYKLIGNIKSNTQSDYYNWKYNGRKLYHNPPNDTINNRYVFVREDYSNCTTTCSDHPDYYYDSYTFTKELIQVNNTESDCNNLITKVIPNFGIEPQKITVSREEKSTSTVCYESVRTRSLNEAEKTIKWSSYNDKKLLDNGYNYTGKNK